MTYNKNPTDEVLKDVTAKLNNFTKVLQDFGLNLIQSIGEMKHQLGVLTEKVDKIESELIEIKGIKKNLQGVERSREELLGETHKILSQLSNLDAKLGANSAALITPAIEKPNFKNIIEVFDYFSYHTKSATTASELQDLFKEIREALFMLTGGNKILFEIREFERKIKPGTDIEESGIKKNLIQKIDDWREKI